MQGTWWTPAAKPGTEPAKEISLEEGLANTLGIAIGDVLNYDIAGSQFRAKVINLRKVRWDSMQVNFFVITAPGLLENYSASISAASICRRKKCVTAMPCSRLSPTCW